MHRTKFTPSGPVYVCSFTGKEFPWKPTPDRSDQTRALRELEAHQRQVRAEREAAAGRKLNLREMIHGIEHNDSRSIRSRISQSGEVRVGIPPDSTDWAAKLAAELRARPGTPGERARYERRAKHYDRLAAEHEQFAQAKREQLEIEEKKTGDSRYQEAVFHAKTIIDELKFNGEAPQSIVEAADRRLAALLATADHKTYWQGALEFVRWRDQRIDEAMKESATITDAAAKLQEFGIPKDVACELASESETK